MRRLDFDRRRLCAHDARSAQRSSCRGGAQGVGAKDEISEEQLKAIHAEKKLSVREMPADAIPEGVDTAPLDRYLAHPATKAAQEKATPAKKTESTTAKAGTKASKDTGAENAGA